MHHTSRKLQDRRVLVYATLATVVMLGWLGYWFVAAERERVFLYDHLGATPFDATTSSRYWMAGFVASGYLCLAVMLITVVGLVRARRWMAAPGAVVGAAAVPLLIGVLVVTVALGSPPLPVGLAALVSLTTLVGVYLAFWAAFTIQRLRWASLLLILEGLGLVPSANLVQVVEMPDIVNPRLAWGIVGAGFLFGVVWRMIMGWGYGRVGLRAPSPWDVPVATAVLGYVALPTLHHLIATPPGYKYVTTASNFMAHSPWLLLATWAAILLIVWATERWRGERCG